MTLLTGVHLAAEEVSLAWLLAESPDTLGGAPPCGHSDWVTNVWPLLRPRPEARSCSGQWLASEYGGEVGRVYIWPGKYYILNTDFSLHSLVCVAMDANNRNMDLMVFICCQALTPGQLLIGFTSQFPDYKERCRCPATSWDLSPSSLTSPSNYSPAPAGCGLPPRLKAIPRTVCRLFNEGHVVAVAVVIVEKADTRYNIILSMVPSRTLASRWLQHYSINITWIFGNNKTSWYSICDVSSCLIIPGEDKSSGDLQEKTIVLPCQ